MMFRKIDRGFNRSLLLLPGWGFDYRIFLEQDWSYNLIFLEFSDWNFNSSELGESFSKIQNEPFSVLAWSIGGFVFDLFLQSSDFPAGKFEHVFFVSVPAYFDKNIVSKIKAGIGQNKKKTMQHFYSLVFYGRKDWYRNFAMRLENKYLEAFSAEYLLSGLKFLENYKLNFSHFKRFASSWFYSSSDVIVAFSSVKNQLPESVCLVPQTHIPFFYSEVADAVNKN